MQAAHSKEYYEQEAILYTAMELSNRKWKLGFSDGKKIRRRTIEARDVLGWVKEVEWAKAKLGLPEDAAVVCCYEAGRDGHWIHRWLRSLGVEVYEIDSSSIEKAQGRKHVKTDRVDVEKLLDLLMRFCLGFRRAFAVVRVPTEEAEAAQRLHREDEHLLRSRARVSNRIKGLLCGQGIVEVKLGGDFGPWLGQVRRWDGQPLSAQLQAELKRLYRQYELFDEQLREVCQAYVAELSADSVVGAQRRQLELLKGIGPKGSRVLSAEVFAWREFANTQQVGAMAGLAPTPSQSGERSREQGISKAGNRRVRAMTIELGWLWLRWQPDSVLSQWFVQRFAHGGKRQRRVGIVALARKLLIALWKYLEYGLVPPGAVFKVKGV
ncbi:MAG: IS110 family transposase [Gammaproteobacteria bacterium]